ncbi:hypothetical protein AJ88_03730 [Mesorhizobium amorphae CCBAU 01583]|nr:hypothetical protein AJ88_03730 [Mesorhizobium amorphae CCBAU 01583]
MSQLATEESLVERQSELIKELRERIRQLEELVTPVVSVPPEWGLTLKESRLYACLTAREVASKDFIMAALYGHRIDGGDPNDISTVVYKLRPKLKPQGIEILTVWGQGYSLRRPQES